MKTEDRDPLDSNRLRLQAEERLRQIEEADAPEAGGNLQRLVHELKVHQIELEMQNDELLRTRAEAEAARERYIDLYEFAPVGYFSLSPDGTIRQANLTGARLLGLPQGELLDRNFVSFAGEAGSEGLRVFLKRAVKSGTKGAYDFSLRGSSNQTSSDLVWVRAEASVSPDGRELRVALADISPSRRSESALRRKMANATLVAEISVRLINVAISETDPVVDESLADIRILAGADRAFVFMIDERLGVMDNTHESCAQGVESLRSRMQGIPCESLPWWMSKFRRGETVMSRLADLASEAAAEEKLLKELDIQAVIAVPIVWAGSLRGILGCHTLRKERVWDSEDTQTLATLANIFALAFERRQAEEERDRLQSQLMQARKMESIGRLAGGIAHDFNNMLGVILGHVELAMSAVGSGALQETLREIQEAAQRSAQLTRQMLTFARKQIAQPQDLSLVEAVAELIPVLKRIIGEDVELSWEPGPAGLVRIDPSQVDQILTNLVANARASIAGAGVVRIETGNASLDGVNYSGPMDCVPGEYVLLSVSDNGRGMGKAVLEHMFEPFFTTKEVGEGTGLGLATVYGIVSQNKGLIDVHSKPGQGTTVRVYLPRVLDAQPKTAPKSMRNPVGGVETLLLVEDEKALLNLAKIILESAGYTVLPAGDPYEALALVEGHSGTIDLLVTDVVMPGMNGKQLRDKVVALRPGIRTLYMSGYTADVVSHSGVLEEDVHFLEKPYSNESLVSAVRRALNQ